MRLHPGVGLGFALSLILALPGACHTDNGGSGGDGGEADGTLEGGDDAAEPLICTEFTTAGAPCSAPSPVRCFAECEAGGCSCTATAAGPRWTCETDLSCLADCGPLDDGCATPIFGDDGAGDDGAGDDGSGDDAGKDGAGDTGGSDGASDSSG